MTTSVASHIYSSFSPIFIASKADYSQPDQKKAKHSRLQSLPLPQFDEEVLLNLCQEATIIFKNTPSVVVIEPPVYVIGDINGSIYDLIRILSKSESFSTHRFIFLGNYIGTGLFSIECLALLYSLVCLCPRNIILLRGSTEFADISEKLGFANEIQQNEYSKELHDAFQESFQWLPFSALISRTYMVAHGRINDDIMTLDDVCRIERPIKYFDPTMSVLSSLPHGNDNIETSKKSNNSGSTVNLGNSAMQSIVGPYTNCFYFNDTGRNEKADNDDNDDIEDQVLDKHILRAFLRHNKLTKFICGNVASPKGVASFVKGRCITVFSMQNYTNMRNKAGFLFIQSESQHNQYSNQNMQNSELILRGHCLPLMRTPLRSAVKFQRCVLPKKERRPKNPRVFATIIKSSMKKPNKPHSNPSSEFTNMTASISSSGSNSRVLSSFSASTLSNIQTSGTSINESNNINEGGSSNFSNMSTSSSATPSNSITPNISSINNHQQQMQFNKYVTQVQPNQQQQLLQQPQPQINFNKYVTQVPQTSQVSHISQAQQQQQQQQQQPPQMNKFVNQAQPNNQTMQQQPQFINQPHASSPIQQQQISSPTNNQQIQQQVRQVNTNTHNPQAQQQVGQGRFQRFQPIKPTQPTQQQQPVFFQQPKSNQANKFMKMIAAQSKKNTYESMDLDDY